MIQYASNLPLGFEIEENESDLVYLDPSIGEGKRLVSSQDVTCSELFAVLRQFVFPVCSKLDLVIKKMLNQGVGINDYDIVSGFNLLHFAVKSASIAEQQSMQVIYSLMSQGADPSMCTLYQHMNCLHLSAYFNLPSVIDMILQQCGIHVDSLCESFDWGSSLHVAVRNFNVEACQALLNNNASTKTLDSNNKSPIEYLKVKNPTLSDKKKINSIKNLIEARCRTQNKNHTKYNVDKNLCKVGSRVVYCSQDKNKLEIIKYKGTVKYLGKLGGISNDVWAGVALDESKGKNDGSIDGKCYFRCKIGHGIFVKPSQLELINYENLQDKNCIQKMSPQGRTVPKEKLNEYLKIGKKIYMKETGTEAFVRFIGRTDFSEGMWLGLELHAAEGRNSGWVKGRKYFSCKENHGIMLKLDNISLQESEHGKILLLKKFKRK